jgi:hypothetical protein
LRVDGRHADGERSPPSGVGPDSFVRPVPRAGSHDVQKGHPLGCELQRAGAAFALNAATSDATWGASGMAAESIAPPIARPSALRERFLGSQKILDNNIHKKSIG